MGRRDELGSVTESFIVRDAMGRERVETREILIDTASLPYSYCAFLYDTDFTSWGYAIGYGHSEEQAVERLLEELESRAEDE